ncbi:MAG TPA: UTRA domain-containing protein, partial [Syntrophorhabdaceae bacterium]|nr:UTRA domain-containing protein [Syntrophorhabdaceae bacterium]
LKLLEIAVIPCPNHVRRMLSVGEDSSVLRTKKVRYHNGTPLSFYLHYTDPALHKMITKEKVEEKTFVELFEEVTGTRLVTLKQRIETVVADIDLSNVLEIRFGMPLFFVENLYLTAGQKPAVLTQNYYRGDRCFYKTFTELRNNSRKG